MFYFYAGTQLGNENKILHEIDEEINRAKKGLITAEELHRAKIWLKTNKRSSLQTPDARGLEAALNALLNIPINDWRKYDEYIDSVTINDLTQFAQKYFKPEYRMQVVVQPESTETSQV